MSKLRYFGLQVLPLLLLSCSWCDAAERFGGIEIGAKGIKVSAIEVDRSGIEPHLTVLNLDKKTVDLTISRLQGQKFSEVKIEDVASVVKDFQTALETDLSVPSENIQVVASSGVPFAQNLGDLIAAVKDSTGIQLTKIEALEEASLTATALVPGDMREKMLVVDIGSGNTKGGTFLKDSGDPNDFVSLDAPFGTATLSKSIDEEIAASGKKRSDVARELSLTLVGDRLRSQVSEKPELDRRGQILFSGGSVWAMVTIMKPETALDPFPQVTVDEIQKYVDLLDADSDSYPEIDFSSVADADARKVAESDFARISGATGDKPVFTPAELLAGSMILKRVAETLNFESKAVFFDRKAVTAWITAKITPEDVRHLLPESLGRSIPAVADLPTPVVPAIPELSADVTRYGGIEIGAKGIKVAAVEVDRSRAAPIVTILDIDKKTFDVTISRLQDKKFNEAKIADVASVVREFQTVLENDLSIPAKNIQVVASSGVPWAKNLGELVSAVKDETGMQLSQIDPLEEASLTATALVPGDMYEKTLVVDIGSGNTKGGTFLSKGTPVPDFASLDAAIGTATLAKAIDDEVAATGKKKSDVTVSLSSKLVGDRFRQQIAEKPELAKRPHVLLSGGSVWAMVTIMKPETGADPFPQVTVEDIRRYAALLEKSGDAYPQINFAAVKNDAARIVAEADYSRITGAKGDKPIFTNDELLAGSAILMSLAETLRFDTKMIHFDRKAMTAWITARITPGDLRSQLPSAFGRKLPDITAVPEIPAQTPDKPAFPNGANLNAPVSPPRPLSLSDEPVGLTMPVAQLLQELNLFYPHTGMERPVLSYQYCIDAGKSCYLRHRYQDALAFARHARNMRDKPSAMFLQGMSELALGMQDEAKVTAVAIQKRGGIKYDVVGPIWESINGPRIGRLKSLALAP